MSGPAAVSVYGRLTVSLPCRENGEDGEASAFFGLVAFGELAESLARHLKGDMVGAFGRVKINRFTNRDGEAREELSIMADGLVSARTVRPGGGRKKKAVAAPRTRCCSPNPTSPTTSAPSYPRRWRFPRLMWF